jgi:hypothetical protein
MIDPDCPHVTGNRERDIAPAFHPTAATMPLKGGEPSLDTAEHVAVRAPWCYRAHDRPGVPPRAGRGPMRR